MERVDYVRVPIWACGVALFVIGVAGAVLIAIAIPTVTVWSAVLVFLAIVGAAIGEIIVLKEWLKG